MKAGCRLRDGSEPGARDSACPPEPRRSRALAARGSGLAARACGGSGFGARLVRQSRRLEAGGARRSGSPGDLFPARQRADAGEVFAGRGVGRDAARHDPLQHHERVGRPAAETLRARQQQHQLRIVRPPFAVREPREIVERLEVLARLRLERRRAAARNIRTARGRLLL